MRFVIGDPHGCLAEFKDLVNKLDYQIGRDMLVVVGDFLDRGPDPVGVVAYAMEIGAVPIRGNHEDNALRWLAYEERVRNEPGFLNPMDTNTPKIRAPRPMNVGTQGWEVSEEDKERGRKRREARQAQGKVPPGPKATHDRRPIPEERKAQWRALSPRQIQWLNAPLACYLGSKWYVVHAGVEGGKTITEQEPERIMRVRYVNPATGRMIGYDEGSMEQPKGSVPWQEVWNGPEHIIYGHTVHSRKHPRIDIRETPNGIVRCIGIDTGCCYSGRLTAAVFDETMKNPPEFVQVDASREYIPSPGPIPDERV
jgi:hypothetical protein